MNAGAVPRDPVGRVVADGGFTVGGVAGGMTDDVTNGSDELGDSWGGSVFLGKSGKSLKINSKLNIRKFGKTNQKDSG